MKKFGIVVALITVSMARASDPMPVAQQNALVHKYCAVCHTDAARNGGLTLEHYDAAQPDPSLAAMLASKLTSGVALETVRAVPSDPAAAALVSRKMKSGAMGAAGIPVPDKATIDALIAALVGQAAGANEWTVNRTQDLLTASILRELPSKSPGEATLSRLVLTCNEATQEGGMQVAWAPVPKTGTASVSADGKPPVTYAIEGTEKMGNGNDVMLGPASIRLYQTSMPAQTLTIVTHSPDETVVFPIGDLPQTARQTLSKCVGRSDTNR
jgi:hypothetical protein